MRNTKILTTQDHVLIFIEGTEENDELTCINKLTNDRAFPAPFMAIGIKGIFKTFLKDENNEWQHQRTIDGPNILFRTSTIEAGTVSLSNTTVLGIFPKKREFLENWISTLGETQMNVAIETSRDSHATIAEGTAVRKMDANTFVELENSISDDIIFQ